MKKIIEAIEERHKDLPSLLSVLNKLSRTEFNSVLLELFKNYSNKTTSADLVKQYVQNRFVVPSSVNVLIYKTLELEWLQQADNQGFKPIILSPITPIGTSSSVGEINQNNVISALRGTEVVSDATNVLAIKIAADFKNGQPHDVVKYATTHRHVRGQSYTNPAFTAHFGAFCLVSGGMDTGSYQFEIEQLFAHIELHSRLLSKKFGAENLFIKFYIRQENAPFLQRLQSKLHELSSPFEVIEAYQKGDYYKTVQFQIDLKYKKINFNLVDGGLVDWTQKMIPNKKHRLFISGCGIEIVHKILENQV
jgi:hypothetical protein